MNVKLIYITVMKMPIASTLKGAMIVLVMMDSLAME